MEELQRQNAEQRELLNALSEGEQFWVPMIFRSSLEAFRLEN